MKKIFLAGLLLLFLSSQAFGVTIDVYDISQTGLINAWIDGRTAISEEDFEKVTPAWYGEGNGLTALSTAVGTFSVTENTIAGTGGSSYKGLEDNTDTQTIAFKVVENSDPLWGRYNTTPTDGERWLDSADVTEILLTLDIETMALYFYLTDPSDVGATTRATGTDDDGSSNSAVWSTRLADANGWFVGISSDALIDTVTWSTDGHTNDGFGLDGFTALAAIPEPATMLLLGTGLIGLAGLARKRIFR